MDAKEFFAFLVSLSFSLGVIITIVALGWICVWKFFLCRFRVVRELFLGEGSTTSDVTSKGGEESSQTKSNGGRRDSSRRVTTTTTTTTTTTSTGAYKSTRSRSRKED